MRRRHIVDIINYFRKEDKVLIFTHTERYFSMDLRIFTELQKKYGQRLLNIYTHDYNGTHETLEFTIQGA